jgi:hypothetical protein
MVAKRRSTPAPGLFAIESVAEALSPVEHAAQELTDAGISGRMPRSPMLLVGGINEGQQAPHWSMGSRGHVSWFVVTTDDRCIHLDVRPPLRQTWEADIPWDSIVRVCFAAEDPFMSDGLYIFTSLRPESWAIPTEAAGGPDLVAELVRRGHFPVDLLAMAVQASSGLYCWPADSAPSLGC